VDGARRADGGAGMITMRVQNLDAVNQALRQYGAKAEQAIGQAIQATGLEVLTDIKKRIQNGPKTGVTYYRVPGEDGLMRIYAGNPDAYGPSKIVAVFKLSGKANLSPTHRASAPGEAPATDTGMLASSVTFKKISTLGVTIESRLPYATWLEFGTQRMAARPAWTPAAEQAAPKLQQRVIRAIEGLV
jgi:hypothetical protein